MEQSLKNICFIFSPIVKTRTSSLPFYYFDKVQVLVDGVFLKAIFYFISTHFQKNETPQTHHI